MSTAGKKRNQRACTSCRQVKHRCNSAETFPAPCSRCQEKSLHCKTDPNFKRTKTRGRLVEVTTQLNAIQKALNDREISVDLASPSLNASDYVISDIASGQPQPRDEFYRYSTIEDLPSTPLALGVVSLEADQLRDFFTHFEQNYYFQFPILDTDMSLSQLHQTSPVLFWAIIIISSRWHPSLFHLYPSLVTGYRDILSKTLLEPFNNIESIQAVSILCVWPFDFWRKIEDPSWSYCGFATNAATRMRINENCTHGLSAKSIRIRRKTWLGVVHINCVSALLILSLISPASFLTKTRLSQGWLIGVPVLQALLTTPTTLHSPCAPSEQRFLARVEIVQTLSKSSATLNSLQDTTHAWNFTLNLGSDLDSIREKYVSCWDTKSEVLLLGAQVCLYTLQVDLDSKSRTASASMSSLLIDQDNGTERRNFINTTYLTAIRLVHTFQSLGDSLVRSSPAGTTEIPTIPVPFSSTYRHLPKFYFWLLVISMAFIFRVRIIYSAILRLKPSDTDPHIRAIHSIFSVWTRDENDHAARGVKLVDMLLKAEKSKDLRAIIEGAGAGAAGGGGGAGSGGGGEVEISAGNAGTMGGHWSRRPGSVVLSDLVVMATRLREDAEREARDREKEKEKETRIVREGNGGNLEINNEAASNDNAEEAASGTIADGCMQDVCFEWEIPWELDMLSQDPYAFLTGL